MSAAVRRKPLRTLKLNADYRPLMTGPLDLVDPQEALKTVLRGGADIVETWPDLFFRSPSLTMPMPKTIALREYVNVHSAPKFCRQSVLLRDRYTCQYCGVRFVAADLSYDHVHPRSKGGKTVWGNIVMACYPCNYRKDQRTCKEAGMWPKHAPHEPTAHQLAQAALELLPNDIKQTWPDYLYWTAELEP